VDDASEDWANEDVKQITINATQYANITAA
jgi:hypothetical protein